jgi:ankyrin repeat protein
LWQHHAYAVSPAISDAMLAAVTGDIDKVRAGLAALPPDQIARWRQTALFLAATNNHPDAVRALIADGADPNARSRIPPYTDRYYRNTVAYMSGDPDFGGPKVIQYLQDKGLMQNQGQWFPHMLIQAADCDEGEVINALIQGGASVHARLSSGIDALFTAVADGNPHATRALLDHGADPCDFDNRAAKDAHETHRKPPNLADIARKQGLPDQLVARLVCPAR